MTRYEKRRTEMLQRVRAFGITHITDFPAESLAGRTFAEVGRIVAELSNFETGQISGQGLNRSTGTTKAVARAAVSEDLKAISRVAQSLELDQPGIADKFQYPRSGSARALLAAARSFAVEAAAIREHFVTHELPADFLEDLSADIAVLAKVIEDQTAASVESVALNRTVESVVKQGMLAVKRLDALVRNRFRTDKSTLAAWASASRVDRPPRKVKSAEPSVAAA